jgi:uncharacterized protein YcfL
MRYFTLSLLILSLGACSSYQYMTLSSSQLKKNDKQQLVFENDTLSLTYDFGGKDGPVSINIHNKTSQPLYVNWKKSALIRDQHPLSYFDRNIPFSASGESYGNRYVSSGTYSGSLSLPEGVTFIPPGSAVSKELVYLSQSGPYIFSIPDSIAPKNFQNSNNTSVVHYRQISYDETGSPMKFKSYLIFTLGLNNTQEFAESADFYVSQTVDTKTVPEEFPLYQQQGDRFFFKYKNQQ